MICPGKGTPFRFRRVENALGMLEVPVIELSGLSEAAKRAYILAEISWR